MINQIRSAQGLADMNSSELANYNITFDKLENSFTGGFESGTPNAKAITSQLINDRKTDIVFPVAGAQTTDLISAIVNSPSNKAAKIIGVDVDQSEQYDYAKEYFLTSAKKGIRESVDWMLWNSFNLKNDEGTISDYPDSEKYFNSEIPPLADKKYIGIFDNLSIQPIYQKLIELDDTYWNLADKVMEMFKKLSDDLANNTNSKKWDNAWQTVIDVNIPDYRPDF
ncbi:hypothetical protein [Spiroplasma platyhelix]|uniref:Ribose/galactose ABC transporter substrate-binding protein n=1 Tax=Spiroplasma platyhelix PALS-1 TaxID=1276218 RepID=A0A846TQS6_9MOLU|nr:hypothetical protein [Spiroplasma platyhelix]MBE4704318.1 hypothetical protein [Spiroplasma platyhelix PALS-1]NKE38690.1 hypothetical protein [Spiroplasma platyhelix PALS-1]